MASRGADGLAGLPDPTRPSPGPAAAGESGGLQSILISPTRRLAVIDGRVCGVGARVDGGVIRQIRPDAVILRTATGRVKKLQLLPRIRKTENSFGAQRHGNK